jgi:hypothetical protein
MRNGMKKTRYKEEEWKRNERGVEREWNEMTNGTRSQ